jgi:hypothetical protein
MNFFFIYDEITDDLAGLEAEAVGRAVLGAFADPDKFRGISDSPLIQLAIEYEVSCNHYE